MKRPAHFILTSLLILSLGLSVTSSLEAAKVYTWKDANGTVHYSDKPFPQASKKQTIEIKAARPRVDTNAQESSEASNELMDDSSSRTIEKECAKARKNLVTLATKKNIKKLDAEGNEVALGEAGVQAEVQRNQSFINQNCQVDVAKPKYNNAPDERQIEVTERGLQET